MSAHSVQASAHILRREPTYTIKLAFTARKEQAPAAGDPWYQRLATWWENRNTGRYNHVECYLPPGTVRGARFSGGWISSMQDAGVAIRASLDRRNDYFCCSCEIPESHYVRMVEFACAQSGKPHNTERSMRAALWYGSTRVVRLLIPEKKTDGASWYCSELIAAILNMSPITRIDSVEPHRTMPQTIYDHSYAHIERYDALRVAAAPPPWKPCLLNNTDLVRKVLRSKGLHPDTLQPIAPARSNVDISAIIVYSQH